MIGIVYLLNKTLGLVQYVVGCVFDVFGLSDGNRLIQALRTKEDPRLRGFRTESTNSLENYLIEKGYIDPRPVLDEAEVLMRVLASPVAARLPSDLTGNFVHRWRRLAEGKLSRPSES